MLLYMFVIFILFFLQTANGLLKFNASEPIPAISHNVPDNKLPFGNGVAVVKSGLFIKNFLEFSEKTSTFELDGIIWFQFNPTIISLDDIAHFRFVNGTIVSKTLLNTRLLGDQLLANYDVRVKFGSTLNDQYFPLNDHRIYLILKNDQLTPEEIHFEVDMTALGIAQNVKPSGWRPVEFEVWPGYLTNQLDQGVQKKLISYPSIVFGLSFAQRSANSVMIVLAPIFILFLFGLLSLLIQNQPTLQFSTSIGSLTGLLVYRFVIQTVIPIVGYFTLTDYMYLIFIVSIFIILIIHVYELKRPLSKELRAGFYYGIQAFALISYYFLTWF